MNIALEIGSKIRYFRKKKGLTVEQLAKKIHKSKSCVSKYESGKIVIDILSLYDLADALDIKITQLLYMPLNQQTGPPAGVVPAFFEGLNHIYMYYFDGRTNEINRCVIEVSNEINPGVYQARMYMNVQEFSQYTQCENSYEGSIKHFDALTLLTFQNLNMDMDRYQIGVPSPYMNAPVKWALAFGISSRPLMPTSTKVLFSKTIQPETADFKKSLKVSKEDIRLMKLYNMLTIM